MADKKIEQMLAEVNLDAQAGLWKLPKAETDTIAITIDSVRNLVRKVLGWPEPERSKAYIRVPHSGPSYYWDQIKAIADRYGIQ
jgi:hypothetical protein